MNEITEAFFDESNEQLGNIESDILILEQGFDQEIMGKIFRAFHTLKGNATALGFKNLSSFAHKIENLLHVLRDEEKDIAKQIIDVLLRCGDEVKIIISDLQQNGSGDYDTSETIALLEVITATQKDAEKQEPLVNIKIEKNNSSTETTTNKMLKVLMAEDESINRDLLQQILKNSPELNINLNIAVNGKEAVALFETAQKANEQYDLIFLDIMMPEMDGQEALEIIRTKETSAQTPIEEQAKIIMTTALDDPKNVMKAYANLCDGYLCKPIKKMELFDLLKEQGLTS